MVMAEVTVLSSYRRWQWPFEKTVDSKNLWLPLNEFGNVVFTFGLSIDRPYPVKFYSIEKALKWLSGSVALYPRDAYVVDDIDSLKCD